MTIAEAAEQVLAQSRKPLHVKAILAEILRQNLVTMAAVDKQQVLYQTLRDRSLGGPSKRLSSARLFYKHDRATFGLVDWLSSSERTKYELEEEHRRASRGPGETEDEAGDQRVWRDELFSFLERVASEEKQKRSFVLQWRGRPEHTLEMVVLNATPRVRVTDALLAKLDAITNDMLAQFRPQDRTRFHIGAAKIRANRGKTISLNQSCNVIMPYLHSERRTLSVNAFEALRIELDRVRSLLKPEEVPKVAALGNVSSFLELAQALGMVDEQDDGEVEAEAEAPSAAEDAVDLEEELDQFERHHNLIFFGPPGTGKSYAVAEIVKHHLEADEHDDVFRVTFHPEYSYFDFVGTYRPATKWLAADRLHDVPVADGRSEPRIFYAFAPGPFSLALVAAARNPDRNIVLLIEEINRGNCAAIFGDVFQLLDRKGEESGVDFGLSEYAITATSEWAQWLDEQRIGGTPAWQNKKLRLPRNLYLYATMNTSDQSLFPMDTAFRRRWGMQYQGIVSKVKPPTRVPLHAKDAEGVLWTSLMEPLNRAIVVHKMSDDKQMGAFFVRPTTGDSVAPLEFSSKVLFYLWADVFRDEPSRVFVDKIRTYDALHHWYESGRDVFRSEILDEVRPAAVSAVSSPASDPATQPL